MDDRSKSKAQLIGELSELRQRLASLLLDRARQGASLQDSAAALALSDAIVQAVREPLLVLDDGMRILSANRSFYVTFRVSPAETIGRCIYEIADRQWDIPELRTLLDSALAQDSPFEDFEVSHAFREIGPRVMLLNARKVQRDGSGAQLLLLAIEDVTERRTLEERLRSASMTDDLTGLYNRRGFFTMADKLLELSKRQTASAHLVYVDLDGLKRINDQLGHEEGDQALVDTARILSQTFRASDVVARIGGDEFAVVLMNPVDAEPDAIRARLLDAVEVHNLERGRAFRISLSVGIADQPPNGDRSLRQLLAEADQEMYEQKQTKRGGPPSPTTA